MKNKETTEGLDKAKWNQVLGFSFNNASTNAVYLLISLYFMVYCNDVYGISAVVVGAIMTATRLFDAVTDPLIGYMIDRTDTRFGRFRPWILGGAIVSAVMFVLMFSGIKTGSAAGDIALVLLFYVVWVLGYTAQTACTKSAQTILTSVPTQRSTVNALGTVNTLIVYLLAMAGVMPVINKLGGIASGFAWRSVALVFGGIQLLYAIFVILSLRKKDVRENYVKTGMHEKPKLRDFFDIFKTNRALQMLIVAASTNKLASTMQSGLTVLFYYYVVKNQTYQSTVSTITMPIMILAMIAMIWIIKRFGRKETFTFSSWGGFLFGLAAVVLVSLNPSNMWWLVLIMAVNMILTAGAQDINIISMIADSADYQYYKTGKFVPGMVGTAFSFIDKVISSLGTLIIGAILTGIGYVSVSTTPQTNEMFWAVLVMYFAFPALGHLASVIAMKFYPLDKKTHEKMLVDLAAEAVAAENSAQ